MKKLVTILIALTLVLSFSACGKAKKPSNTVTGGVVTGEIFDKWRLVTGEEACGDPNYDFIYLSNEKGTNYFTVQRSTSKPEHFKDMIATGNYGKDLGSFEIGEGTWYISEKVAAGPIGDNTCIINAYEVDLSSADVQAVLATLKWVK